MTAGSGTVTDTNFFPSYSVLDSDNSGPTNPPEYLAHSYKVSNVCQVHSGEREHHRSIGNCTKLLQQIENKSYFETNSQWSNREEIPTAAGLMYHVVSPYAGGSVFMEYGQFIITYTYVFTQRHEVGESAVKADVLSQEWLQWKKQQDNSEEKISVASDPIKPWTNTTK